MVKLIEDTLNKPHSVFNAHKFVAGYNSISTHIFKHIYIYIYLHLCICYTTLQCYKMMFIGLKNIIK